MAWLTMVATRCMTGQGRSEGATKCCSLYVVVGWTPGHGLGGLTVPVQHRTVQVAVIPSAKVLALDGGEDLDAERVEVFVKFLDFGQIRPSMLTRSQHNENSTKYS